MTYSTENPLGSEDSRDLFDNARNIDHAANSQTAESWTDRFGASRKTWHGIERQAELDTAHAVSEATAEAGGYRDQAKDARDDAVAAASAAGPAGFYETYSKALEDVVNIPIDGLIEIAKDETLGGARTRYFRRSGAVLEFAINLDQLRLDLKAEDGSQRVTFRRGEGGVARSLQEKLSLELASSSDWPGVDLSGATPSSDALSGFLSFACSIGGKFTIPQGFYLLDKLVEASLSASVEFSVSPSAMFIAKNGFPATKMLRITAGSGNNHIFKWRGGNFDGSNIPRSLAGEANDIFYFTASNCSSVDIEIDRTYTGENSGISNGDCHLFISEGSRIRAVINDARGANDSAIYVSGSISGDGESVEVDGSFRFCNTAAIVKRNFRVMKLMGRVVDCENGVGTGIVTDGSAPFGGDALMIDVTAIRTTTAAFTQGTRGGYINVVSKNMGCTANGSIPTVASALSLTSGEGIGGTVIADGVNPELTLNNNFNGIRTNSRTVGAETRHSIGNKFSVIARNIGRSVVEGSGSDQNVFDILEVNSAAPTLIGPSTKVTRRAGGAFSVFSGDDVALGGRGGTEAGSIAWFRSSAQKTNVNRPQFSAGDAGEQVAMRATGSDANIDFLIEAKGNGVPKYNPGQVKNYADDVAAASGGIPIGGVYRTSNALKIRIT